MNVRSILPPRDQIEPVEPGDCISPDMASTVNESLADYRQTGNPLCLFEAADRCNAHRIPLPEAVQHWINGIVSGIHRLSESGGGRAEIADIVLATRNDQGGRNWFQRKKEWRALKKLCSLVDERLYQAEWVEGDQTETQVFEEVAEKLGLEPEHVRKEYRRMNPAYDHIGAKTLRKARRLLNDGRPEVDLDDVWQSSSDLENPPRS